MQLLQQSASRNGSYTAAYARLNPAATTNITTRPGARRNASSSGSRTGTASIAALRTSGGPTSQPTQSGANQTTPSSTVIGPRAASGRAHHSRVPAPIRPSPAVRSATAATELAAAYVVGWFGATCSATATHTAPYAIASAIQAARDTRRSSQRPECAAIVDSHIPIATGTGDNRPITGRLITFLAFACAVFAGCFGGTGAANKAGSVTGPVTLRVATDDPGDRPGSNALEELARRVRDLSDGTVRLQIVLNAGGDGSDWDQNVARKVTAGDVDIGLVPARAWDTEGITTLRALSAPFLITSDQLLDDVVTSDLADDLMSGLDG